MKKKVVQLIASESLYNENLQMNLKKNEKFVSHFDLIEISIDKEMKEFEETNNIKKFKELSSFKRIIYLYRFNKYLIIKYKYLKGSILHIQFVQTKYAFMIWFFKTIFSKIVTTFWGSDLLRIKENKKILLRVISHYSDIITFETKSFSQIFCKKISDKYSDKIRIVDFGIQILDDIDNIDSNDINAFKREFKIDNDRVVAAIGYSRIVEHQHIDTINSLIKSNIKKNDIFIVIPWTYGFEVEGYREKIEDLIKDKFDYVFIDRKLTNKEMATLRCVIDILIHVETTDVLSFSMLETLYAKKNVITGSWLPYDDIYKCGVVMERVDRVDEVGERIKKILNRPLDIRIAQNNRRIIERLYRWDNCIDNWVSLYM